MAFQAHIIFTGTVRAISDLKYTANQTPYINVSLPEDKQGYPTVWYNITIWGKTAEFVADNFRVGTVATFDCYLTVFKNDTGQHYKFNAKFVTPLSNWGTPRQQDNDSAPEPSPQKTPKKRKTA